MTMTAKCPQPVTIGMTLAECGRPADIITTNGGEPFALVCRTAGHITPQQSARPLTRRCRTCGCRSGHATGCKGPEQNRKDARADSAGEPMARTATPPQVERGPETEECFDHMEIWALELRPAYRSADVPIKEFNRDAEPAIQVQLWYEWARVIGARAGR
jgi:hypothetical protein